MKAEIEFAHQSPPLPLPQGERIACRAVAQRRREVRGSKRAEVKAATLTLPSPLGRERRPAGAMQAKSC
jgi:hypothetical protein